jgi:hemerythrin-like metal-binding protein
MKIVEWKPEFATHVPELDRDRQYQYGIANRFHQAMLAGQGKKILGTIFEELTECAIDHSANAEKIMTSIRYPGMLAKIQENNYISHRISKMKARFERGETAMTIELMNYLLNVNKNYLMVADRQLGEYVKTLSSSPQNRNHRARQFNRSTTAPSVRNLRAATGAGENQPRSESSVDACFLRMARPALPLGCCSGSAGAGVMAESQ